MFDECTIDITIRRSPLKKLFHPNYKSFYELVQQISTMLDEEWGILSHYGDSLYFMAHDLEFEGINFNLPNEIWQLFKENGFKVIEMAKY